MFLSFRAVHVVHVVCFVLCGVFRRECWVRVDVRYLKHLLLAHVFSSFGSLFFPAQVQFSPTPAMATFPPQQGFVAQQPVQGGVPVQQVGWSTELGSFFFALACSLWLEVARDRFGRGPWYLPPACARLW